jgi:predicted nucleic acid-binding Zn ribbon protein
VLDELGLDRANTLRELTEAWDRILERELGPAAAGHSRPTGLRGTVLEATADSSAWCHHLQLQRERILAALGEELGREAPTDLWFRVG